jgi:hypothetical protein
VNSLVGWLIMARILAPLALSDQPVFRPPPLAEAL